MCLPIAPRRNIKYNLSFLQNDYMDENDAEVDENALTPEMAMDYLTCINKREHNHIHTVFFIGPGHPFASPNETIKTMKLVRQAYPEIKIVVTSNGLNLLPYIYDMLQINITQVRLLINAVDPKINALILRWVRYGQRTYRGTEAAGLLIDNQLTAISRLKSHGVPISVSSILIDGINDCHMDIMANKFSNLKLNNHTIIPLKKILTLMNGYEKKNFEKIELQLLDRINSQKKPDYRSIRKNTNQILEAIIITEQPGQAQNQPEVVFQGASDLVPQEIVQSESRPFIAAISREGVLVNQNFMDADRVFIFEKINTEIQLVGTRLFPQDEYDHGKYWDKVSALLNDCSVILVKGIDPSPKQVFLKKGLQVIETQGVILERIEFFVSKLI